jgi:antitoxin HicB
MGAKKLEEYLKLPYTIEIIQDFNEENPGWVARVVELPGCFTESDTFEGLQAMLEDAMRLWIATALEDGLPIPEPRDLDSYSGKFIVRVPKSLHRQLAEQAQREDISLNQYVSTILARAVGVAQASSTPTIPSVAFQVISKDLSHVEKQQTSMVREEAQDYLASPNQDEKE